MLYAKSVSSTDVICVCQDCEQQIDLCWPKFHSIFLQFKSSISSRTHLKSGRESSELMMATMVTVDNFFYNMLMPYKPTAKASGTLTCAIKPANHGFAYIRQCNILAGSNYYLRFMSKILRHIYTHTYKI